MSNHSTHADHEHSDLEIFLGHRILQLEKQIDLMVSASTIQKRALLQCLPEAGVIVEIPENVAPTANDGTLLTRLRVLVVDGNLDLKPL